MTSRYDDKPYSQLGGLLTELALQRRASNPHAVAKLLAETTGHISDGQEISDYLSGARRPDPKFMPAFAEAFSLTVEERRKLSWLYTYSRLPD